MPTPQRTQTEWPVIPQQRPRDAGEVPFADDEEIFGYDSLRVHDEWWDDVGRERRHGWAPLDEFDGEGADEEEPDAELELPPHGEDG